MCLFASSTQIIDKSNSQPLDGERMKRHTRIASLALAFSAASGIASVVNAQNSGPAGAPATPVQPAYKIGGDKPAEDGPRSISLADGVGVTPYFNVSSGRDDNLFLSNINKRTSNVTTYNPGLRLVAEGASSRFGLGFDSKIGRYAGSSDDNYVDYKVDANADFVFTSSLGLNLGADYNRGHDPRGSTDRGVSGKPDEHRVTGPSLLLAYGANEARGRIEFQAGQQDRRYLNNRTTTIGSDRDTDNFAGRFFLRVAPKTSALVEYREDRFDYKLTSSTQDSKEKRMLVGLTWDATAATSGTVKVGRIKKEFEATSRRDFSGTGWEGSVSWKPLSYSKVDLFTTKSFNESTGLGDFLLNKRYGANWTHGWNSRLTSVVMLSRSDDDFGGNTRTDQTDTLGLKLNYRAMRWLTIGGEVTNSKRDSSNSAFNYKKNVYMFTLAATL
jgi:hypothetical protein